MATEQQASSGSGQDNKDPVYGPLQRQDSIAADTASTAAAPPPPPPPPAAPADDLQGGLHERPGDGGGSPSLAAAAESAAAADRKGKKVVAVTSSSSSSSVSSNSESASPVVSSSASSNSPPASPDVSKVASGRKVRVSWKDQVVQEVVAVPKLVRPTDLKNVFQDLLQEAERQEKGQVKPRTVWPNKDSSLWSKVKSGMMVLEGIRSQMRFNRYSTFTAPQVNETVIHMTDMIQYYERRMGQGKIFNSNEQELRRAYSGFRPVLGDGECFYRSFIFSYLEQVLDRQDTHEEHRLLAAVKEVAMLHRNLGWNTNFLESCKAFKKMIKKVKRWKRHSRWKHGPTTNSYRTEKLLKFFSRYDATKHIFSFLRLVAAIWICSHQEEYTQRVTDLTDVYTLRHWCFEEVIREKTDANHVQMTALVTALGVPLRVENLFQGIHHVLYTGQGGQDTEDNVPRCTCRPRHIVPPDHQVPRVTVLYVNNHYDIIYPHHRDGSLPFADEGSSRGAGSRLGESSTAPGGSSSS
ncbi:hypothetical protein QOZ80_2BG0187600 [Eleusine coracana subsp. coracana]|nr:hypothetical protein QOZ80_2BG0187600 [Eleusine coracana subsp. coracana]